MTTLSDPDFRRRELLLGLLGFGALGVSGCAANGAGVDPELFPPDRSIYRLRGDVRVNGLAAVLATPIPAGARIETGPDSHVVFVSGQDAFILRERSDFTLPGPPAATPAGPPRFRLDRGKALSVFASRRLDLATPQAVVAVRGTGVYVEAYAVSAYVCTCYGVTDIGAAADASVMRRVAATHHDAPVEVHVGGDGPPQIVDAPFRDHDDEELLLIETLVGRTTPFFVPGGLQRAMRRYG